MVDVPKLVTGTRPDKEVADDLRTKVMATLAPVLEVMTDAKRQGFEITFNLGTNNMGQAFLQVLKITKDF